MNGKERFTRAIEFTGPDRIPLNDEDMFNLGGDKNWIVKSWYFNEEAQQWQRDDIWGCYHRSANRDLPGYHVENHPIDSWDKLAGYQFPDPDTMVPRLEKRVGMLEDEQYQGKYHMITIDPGPFLVIINLMEYQNFLIQCVDSPGKVRDLYRRISDYKFELIRLAHQYTKPDGVVVFEDWGSQRGPLISPAMFREIFKPVIKEMIDRCHDLGMHYGFQASGDTGDLLLEYMDIGLDFLYETQVLVKHLDRLCEMMKGKLCLMSCCDCQRTLPRGTPEDVRDEVNTLVDRFATPAGGLVLLNLSNPGGVPVSEENQLMQQRAMYQACGL